MTGAHERWPAADWYADPSGRHAMRYWDGEQWTERVADATTLALDPVDSAEVERLRVAQGDLRSPWPARVAVVGVATVLVADALGFAARGLAALFHLGPIATFAIVGTVLYGALIAVGIAVHRRYTPEVPFSEAFGFRWTWSDIPFGFLASVVARMAAGIAIVPVVLISRRFVSSNLPTREQAGGHVPLLVALTIVAVIVAPLVEEFFFRGLIQRSLETRLRPATAIAVASALFGLAHLSFRIGIGGIGLVIATGTGGAVFGITTRLQKRIGTSIVAHALFNALPIAILWAAR